MISTILDDIFSRIKETDSPVEPSQLKALLHSALQQADVVSRDEFDSQKKVLLRTRERVQALEKQLSVIEKQLEESVN